MLMFGIGMSFHYNEISKERPIGDRMFGPCREVGSISEFFLQIHFTSL